MANHHPREVAQMNRLLRQREGAAQHRLRGNDGGNGGQSYERKQEPGRGQKIERIDDGIRLAEEQCALSKVLEQEAREDDPIPSEADRFLPEMSHISIEGFGARQGEKHAAEHHESLSGVHGKKQDAEHRIH